MNEFEISGAMQGFRRYLFDRERSPATVEKYLRDVGKFLEFGGVAAAMATPAAATPSPASPLTPLTRQNILSYKAFLVERYAPASVNSMLAAVNCFLKFCGRHELCAGRLRCQRAAFTPGSRELTDAEYRRLVTTAATTGNDRICLALQAICATGIRVSELRYITVEAARGGGTAVSCKGKLRQIFIVPELARKLLNYAKKRGISTGSIFLSRYGNPLSRFTVWREMKQLCAAANVLPGKAFLHNLRHLFARRFYANNKDLAKLAAILGHSNINTTMIYTATTEAEHMRMMIELHLII